MNMIKQLMMRSMGLRPGMISCAELDAFICDYLDDALPPKQLKIFERHLAMCEACRDYLDAYRNTIEAERLLLTTPHAPAPEDVPEDLITAILDARNSDQK